MISKALELDRNEQATTMAALTNGIILRRIYSHLSFSDLIKCRLVNQKWNFEVATYMKDFRQCHVKINENTTCSQLYALNQLVSQMSIVPINSLFIELCPYGHWNCQFKGKNYEVYGELLKTKFHLKFLKVRWQDLKDECPATNFVITLLRDKATELRTLLCTHLPPKFPCFFDKSWTPWFPRLKTLRLGRVVEAESELDLTWACQKEFFLKMINAAPNLEKLEGYFNPEVLKSLPEEKYPLVATFHIFIDSSEQESRCFKLVRTGTEMTRLTLDSVNTRVQYLGSFSRLIEQLLENSQKSLYTLTVNRIDFHLIPGTFPGLKKIAVSTEVPTKHLVDLFRSIDYSKSFPVLAKVQMTSYFAENDEPEEPNNIVGNPLELHASTTVKTLKLQVNMIPQIFIKLSEIFPNVRALSVYLRVADERLVPYEDLWACWPQLESIVLEEESAILRRNLDAEFLGIYPEEVNLLRDFDDESLEKTNVVPIRPSIMTMLDLKYLTIEITHEDDVAQGVDPDQVFLSRLTGILAFRKLARNGVSVRINCAYPPTASLLSHLMPFALVSDRY